MQWISPPAVRRHANCWPPAASTNGTEPGTGTGSFTVCMTSLSENSSPHIITLDCAAAAVARAATVNTTAAAAPLIPPRAARGRRLLSHS